MRLLVTALSLLVALSAVPGAAFAESEDGGAGPAASDVPSSALGLIAVAEGIDADVYRAHIAAHEAVGAAGPLDAESPAGPQVVPSFAGLLGPSPSGIFPPDDRTRVSPTTGFPWRTVVKLDIYQGDAAYMCSGSIVDAFHVLTAGHCIYLWDEVSETPMGWADAIAIAPGQDGPLQPFGEAWATNLRTYPEWISSADYRNDWGLITLDRSVGLYTGWMGRMTLPATDPVYSGTAITAGYPGDLYDGEYMYTTSDVGCGADEYNHHYRLDSFGGQSGSAVWYNDGTDRYILTVHAYNNPVCNFGTRLNSEKFATLSTWLTLDPPPVDLADLLVVASADASFGPSAVAPGVTTLSVSAKISNQGTAGSGAIGVALYLSLDPQIGSGDTLLGVQSVPGITPFASTTMTWSGKVPSSTPSGKYWVGWVIDAQDAVAEFNETNNVGFVDSQPLIVDGSPPTTDMILSGSRGNGPWYRSAVQIMLHAADNLSGVSEASYRVDGGAWTSYAAPVSVRAQGMHVVEWYATDRLGNTEAVRQREFGVDDRPPEVFLVLSPAEGDVVNGTLLVLWEGNDTTSGIDHYTVALDGGTAVNVGTGTSSRLTGIDGGAHTVTVSAVDAAGNVATRSVGFQVPGGPLSGLLLWILIAAVAIAVAVTLTVVALVLRKRKRARTMPPPL